MRALVHQRSGFAMVAGLLLVAVGCASEPAGGAAVGQGGAASGAAGIGGTSSSGGNPAAGATALGGRGGASSSGGATTQAASAFESVARRLSVAELDNVIADVLRDTTRPAARALVEDEYAPYDNDYTLQAASQTLIDGLNSLAEDTARRLMADPARRMALVPCAPSGPGDVACFQQTIEQLGAKLLRRPLASSEVTAYLALQSFATENNPNVPHDFYTGVELFLCSVLQDPEFLYRIETGSPTPAAGVFKLDAFELASRLSFLIWGSAPDDALSAEARAGALTTAEAREASARRMLADARAKTQLYRYHALWLGYRAIPHPATLTRGFEAETNGLINRVVFTEKRDYLDLFTFAETYVDSALADHYGLTRPSTASGWVPYGTSGRAGILSHGSVLSAFSKFSDTSPTQRGIFVRTRLLCQDIPPAPASVNVDQPPMGGQSMCKTARYAAHRATSSCAACHNLVDPIGLGLEKFDMAGRYREHDDGMPECVLDGRGELPGYGTFAGPGELARKLTENGLIDACAVQQYLTFAAGRRLRADEQPLVDARVQAFRAGGRDLSEMIVAHAAGEAFGLRKEPSP